MKVRLNDQGIAPIPQSVSGLILKVFVQRRCQLLMPCDDFLVYSQALEEMAGHGYEIADLINDWRQQSKLKSSFTDSLAKKINKRTGRIHTRYAMAATTTGRLSSLDPNLQNIPAVNFGKKVRETFIPEEGYSLLSADYSQIELRLLAHMANIDALVTAFHQGTDVHALTASQVFGVPLDQMTSDIRRSAKAINFGIIYGQSAFGLAKGLNVSVPEAQSYIDSYFKQVCVRACVHACARECTRVCVSFFCLSLSA